MTGATPAQIEFARRWRDMAKVVFSSTTRAVDWNARLVTDDAVTEITRLKTEDGGPMDVAGATLAAAAMRAGLIDEYAIITHPVLGTRRQGRSSGRLRACARERARRRGGRRATAPFSRC